MRMLWLVRAMTRLWDWATPGLIALEPGAMALHEAWGDADISLTASADFPTGLLPVVKVQLPSQTGRNELRVEGFGK
jgi:hypothetical protein